MPLISRTPYVGLEDLKLPEWFLGSPSIEFIPLPVPDSSRHWGTPNCKDCGEICSLRPNIYGGCVRPYYTITYNLMSTTVAVIHHPSVLNILSLESCSTSAKISYLATVTLSSDPMIEEISRIALSSNFGHAHEISNLSRDALSTAINSIASINRKTLHKSACSIHVEARKEKWDSNLDKVTVQRKFSDACSLEKENSVWNRILDGLPPGQLSFILRAASDTLPTPLNLRRWRLRVDSKCSQHACTVRVMVYGVCVYVFA